MNEDRVYLHSLLQAALPGVKLIFRPPSQNVLEYPCAVYDVSSFEATYANNGVYTDGTSFLVTLMSRLPGYNDPKQVLTIPGARHDRSYVNDGIVHDIFTIQTGV